MKRLVSTRSLRFEAVKESLRSLMGFPKEFPSRHPRGLLKTAKRKRQTFAKLLAVTAKRKIKQVLVSFVHICKKLRIKNKPHLPVKATAERTVIFSQLTIADIN